MTKVIDISDAVILVADKLGEKEAYEAMLKSSRVPLDTVVKNLVYLLFSQEEDVYFSGESLTAFYAVKSYAKSQNPRKKSNHK